jgi:hypothetical protein
MTCGGQPRADTQKCRPLLHRRKRLNPLHHRRRRKTADGTLWHAACISIRVHTVPLERGGPALFWSRRPPRTFWGMWMSTTASGGPARRPHPFGPRSVLLLAHAEEGLSLAKARLEARYAVLRGAASIRTLPYSAAPQDERARCSAEGVAQALHPFGLSLSKPCPSFFLRRPKRRTALRQAQGERSGCRKSNRAGSALPLTPSRPASHPRAAGARRPGTSPS